MDLIRLSGFEPDEVFKSFGKMIIIFFRYCIIGNLCRSCFWFIEDKKNKRYVFASTFAC